MTDYSDNSLAAKLCRASNQLDLATAEAALVALSDVLARDFDAYIEYWRGYRVPAADRWDEERKAKRPFDKPGDD